jgi:hypothetical protein
MLALDAVARIGSAWSGVVAGGRNRKRCGIAKGGGRHVAWRDWGGGSIEAHEPILSYSAAIINFEGCSSGGL